MNILHSLTDWVASTSLRASMLVLVILALQTLARNHLPARWRYRLWLPALLVLLTPAFPESRWSLESLLHSASTPVTAALVEKPGISPPEFATEAAALPTDMLEPSVAMATVAPDKPVRSSGISWSTVLGLTWAAGFACLLVGGQVSYQTAILKFRRQAMKTGGGWRDEVARLATELQLRQAPEILVSPAVPSPAVTGILRPILMLPAHFGRGLSEEESRLILKHELMHLKRGDLKINFLLCLLMAMHWFNPLLWLAFLRSRTDREAACDAQVLHQATAATRHAYGSALLKIESAFSSGSLSLGFVGIFQKGTAIRSRVRTLAESGATHPALPATVSALMVVMVFLGMTQAQSPDSAASSFQLGQAVFRTGDLISIQSVERNEQGLTVSGEYELVTQAKAMLFLSVTQTEKNPGVLPADPRQKLEIQKGRGSFKLVQPNPPEGLPHVTFYGQSADSDTSTKPFGAVYFGTFEEAEASSDLPLGYLMHGWVMQNFTVGQAAFRLGDSIQIKSMTRNEDVITVSGEYTLASEDSARLSLYITGDVKKAPFDQTQETTVQKGSGTFTLSHPKPYPGLPHLTFYRNGKPDDSHAFGTLYFGSLEEAKASRKLNLGHLLASQAAKTARVQLVEKMNRILMPNVLTMRMSLREAVNYLQTESKKLDTQEPDPAKRGVNIQLHSESTAKMTVLLKDMSLMEAIRYLTSMSGTRYRLDDNGVHIEDAVPLAKNPTLEKMKSLILPRVQFSGATLEEAVEFLRAKSQIQTTNDTHLGINFVVKKGAGARAFLTLDLKDVPMLEVVKYVTELSETMYRTEANTIVIEPLTNPSPPAKSTSAIVKSSETPPSHGKAAERARNIILPQVNFAGASVEEALEYFRSALMNREDARSHPTNIILKPGGSTNAQISLELKDVPLLVALRYVAELGNCTLSSDDHSLILQPE